VRTGAGIGLIVGASLLGALLVVALWRRLPSTIAMLALTGIGAAVAAGALLVQDRVSGAEWTIATVVIGVLTPIHARLVFGRPGAGREAGVVAVDTGAAYKGRNP
jgi:hypothetical protein